MPLGCLVCTSIFLGVISSMFQGLCCFRQESNPSYNAVRFLSKDVAVEAKLCQLKGQFYVHGDFVPTSDPCRNCMCFRGDVLCWKRECPPPEHMQNCKEIKLMSRCCPVYACPAKNVIPMYSDSSIAFQSAPEKPEFKDCYLDGRKYTSGEIIDSATSPCLRCRCGDGGNVICDRRPCSSPWLEKDKFMKPPAEKPVVNIQKYKLNEVKMKKSLTK